MSVTATYPCLKGRTALVTGAGGGIGDAICKSLVAQGVTVFASDRSKPRVEGCNLLELDVTCQSQWAHAFERISTEAGKLDVLVNNAGIYAPASLNAETAEGFSRIMDVNQFGTFWGMKASLPVLSDGASIINVSSIGGMVGDEGSIGYTGSKWSVRGMTRSAARELSQRRIRVNTVCPGIIDTPMFYENNPDQAKELLTSVPLGVLGQPEDIANAILFLASDQSRYITGSDILVDGGYMA